MNAKENKDMSCEGIEGMGKKLNLEEISLLRLPHSEDGFKVVGYFPSLYGDVIDQIKWDKLTHVNYAFAIPTTSGTVVSLEDTALVEKLIKTAHENNVMVGLSIGGWSYHNERLEKIFEQATDTDKKCKELAENLLAVVDEYKFDGVDVDWEYPNAGVAAMQYEFFMTFLRKGLTTRYKYLTAAVVGSGNIGEGQTEYILAMLDWVNVMSYDGDNGSGHSPFNYMLECGEYWINTRKVDSARVVIGVPFYGRPNGTSFADIVAKEEAAAYKDTIDYNGTTVYYNGLKTMADKTNWACSNAGGIMIWEIFNDSKIEGLTLLGQINTTIIGHFPDYKKK